MSMESGAVSFRIFYVTRPMPQNAIERFAEHAAPAIDTLSDGSIHGWVTGRHMLDRAITDDTATLGGFLRLTLMQAERKIPESLLRAECKMEELAHMKAQETDCLSGSARRGVVTPHCLRHAYITHTMDSGANPHDVQKAVGHAHLDTTMAYVHAEIGRVKSPLEAVFE